MAQRKKPPVTPTFEPDVGQPEGLQPDGSYVLAPGRGERSPVLQHIAEQVGEQPPFVNDAERSAFIDAAAIAVFASGWPLKTVWQRAEQLWQSRVRYKRGEVVQ